jgi:hypothetical protein
MKKSGASDRNLIEPKFKDDGGISGVQKLDGLENLRSMLANRKKTEPRQAGQF